MMTIDRLFPTTTNNSPMFFSVAPVADGWVLARVSLPSFTDSDGVSAFWRAKRCFGESAAIAWAKQMAYTYCASSLSPL